MVKELYQTRYIATRAKLLDWGRVRWKAEGFDLPLLGFDFESLCYGEQMAAARREKAATSGPAAVKRSVSGRLQQGIGRVRNGTWGAKTSGRKASRPAGQSPYTTATGDR